MKMSNQHIIDALFDNMHGYGFADVSRQPYLDGKAKLAQCINSIPPDLLADFLYSMYRIADKSGPGGFDVNHQD
jgi:hypothetical protein